jgi:hypothetical protein
VNRRNFLKNAGLAGLGAGLAGPLFAADKATPAAPVAPVRGTPAVYAPTPDGATVIWPVAENSIGWVEYGEAGSPAPGKTAKADGFGFIANGERVLRVRLHGLVAGKSYWYRTHTRPVRRPAKTPAGSTVTVGETYSLRIPNPDAKETSFCVWNDTHDRADTLALLSGLTRAEPADFLFWNGDVSNNINREADITGLYLQPKGDVDLAKGPPILFVRGNHDVRGAEANRLPRYIDYPGGKPYYSFRSGPVAAIVLDTGEDKPDDHPSFLGLVDFEALIHEQAAWLAKEIEKPHLKDAPYKMVFCHIPLRWKKEENPDYANGGFDHWSRRGRAAWHDSLVKWGAQIVLSGHTHERHHMPASSKFPYAQLVGGGPGRDAKGESDLPLLIRAKADATALTFRLFNARTGAEVFTTSIAPRA